MAEFKQRHDTLHLACGVYSLIVSIMAALESQLACEALHVSEILTESKLEDEIQTTSFDTTRDLRIAIKTTLLFKLP